MLRRRHLPSIRFPSFFPSLILSFSSSSCLSSCKQRASHFLSSSLRPPALKKISFTVSAHGVSWDDPFHWMSNTDDPDLLRYLNQENSYADSSMADTMDLQRKLAAEMKSRIPPVISTPPERWGKWLYYQVVPEGREYPILCRKLSPDGSFMGNFLNHMRGPQKEEILLDWNDIAQKHGYVHIGTCRISPDHNYLAYTLDTRGSELFMLQIKDLRSGCVITDSKVEGVVSLAWAKDSSRVLYTRCDENQRPNRVFCRDLGNAGADDLLFIENDLSCCVDITSTKDGKFITINSNSRASSEVYVIDAQNLKNGLWPVRKRVPGVQYFLEHYYGFFYVLTNTPLENTMPTTAEGYYIVRCRAERSMLANWKDVLLPGPDITIQDMDIFHGHMVLSIQKNGLPMLCSLKMPLNLNDKEPKKIEDFKPWFFPLPSSICSFQPGSNSDFTSSTYRVIVSSPVIPDLVVDYDMVEQRFTFLQQDVVGQRTNSEASPKSSFFKTNKEKYLEKLEATRKWANLSEAYSCERREVVSHDGVMVPLTILYSQDSQYNSNAPGLLYGYGAYGEVLDKSWSPEHISLLARGWVIAYVDVRGGGGDASWHQAGTKMKKLNSFHDFAACAFYLVSEGFVHKSRLAAIGCSAGGLLVSVTMNKYPDLFCAAILKVPFLDICNTMLDPSLPLTILDYDEFGDPSIQAEFEYIHGYSPYDNIHLGVCYPPTLVTTSFHDSRVGVWEAAKWVAKVREKTCPTCSLSIVLKTNMNGGHFCEGGRLKHCEDTAFEYAFLMKAMGLLNDEEQRYI